MTVPAIALTAPVGPEDAPLLVLGPSLGTSTVLWGQVRPHDGKRPYRLQRFVSGRWVWITGTPQTNEHGFLRRVVRAGPGAKFRLWSALDRRFGFVLVVR